MRRRAILGALVALALLPASAAAHGGISRGGGELRYYALDPGGVSTASVSLTSDGSIEISDPTVFGGMSPGPCIPITEHKVQCPADGITSVLISTGPENDSIRSEVGLAMRFTGGPGDDTLTGGAGPDRLDAGRGRDLVDGGDGDDDLVTNGDGEIDTVRCGAGTDRVFADPGDVIADGPACESVQRIDPQVSPPTGTQGPDVTPPAITRLRVKPARVSAASKRRSVKLTWRLSEAARLGFRLVRCRPGAKRCTARAGRPLHVLATEGRGSIGLRLPRNPRPGRYRVRARATDGAGNRSELRTVALRIVR